VETSDLEVLVETQWMSVERRCIHTRRLWLWGQPGLEPSQRSGNTHAFISFYHISPKNLGFYKYARDCIYGVFAFI